MERYIERQSRENLLPCKSHKVQRTSRPWGTLKQIVYMQSNGGLVKIVCILMPAACWQQAWQEMDSSEWPRGALDFAAGAMHADRAHVVMCRRESTPRIWPSVWRAPQRHASSPELEFPFIDISCISAACCCKYFYFLFFALPCMTLLCL